MNNQETRIAELETKVAKLERDLKHRYHQWMAACHTRREYSLRVDQIVEEKRDLEENNEKLKSEIQSLKDLIGSKFSQ